MLPLLGLPISKIRSVSSKVIARIDATGCLVESPLNDIVPNRTSKATLAQAIMSTLAYRQTPQLVSKRY